MSWFDPVSRERLFGCGHAFDSPVTLAVTLAIVGTLVAFGVLLLVLRGRARPGPKLWEELYLRWKSWCWLAGLLLAPILLGAAWTIAAVAVLSLLCYREYARTTGVFRERLISVVVVAGVLTVAFAAFDHYDRLFFAAGPLTVGLLAVVTIPQDRPQGYLQRTALGTFGFLLFGFSLGYLGLLTTDANYRPVLLLILVAVELNDVFAFCVGKAVGGRKLAPHTSPGKTVAGSVGALVLTTLLVAGVGWFVFAGTAVARPDRLILLGLLLSVLGQLGDLVLSSIKRDVGVKDFSRLIPGHGGVLDRFDSLVFVPPAVFHYLSLNLGPLGADQPARILTGG